MTKVRPIKVRTRREAMTSTHDSPTGWYGRVRTLQITIIWFGFFTFLCGFAQSYTQLFIFRALMDLGFGGEWAAGAGLTATC